MSKLAYFDKLQNIIKTLNTQRRKLAALILFLILFTKIGTPNILYVLQYAECIIKLILFKKRIKYASSTAIYYSRVHLYDIDFWLHMNNAAYLRHAELARVDYFIRSKIWNQLQKHNYAIAFVALNIRYRRELTVFKKFEIQTRPIFWDELHLIIEQRFLDPKTKFLHTLIYGRYVLIKNGKKVKRSISDNLVGDGLHTLQFYEKSLINNIDIETSNSNGNSNSNHNVQINNGNFTNNGFNNGIEEEKKDIDDNDDTETIISFVNNRSMNLNKNNNNNYECR
eukprot:325191_1